MRTLHLAVVLAVLPSLRQEPVEAKGESAAPSAVEALDALIERVNALPGFRARYQMTRPGEETRTFELSYAAPDRMRLDMSGAEIGQMVHMWSAAKRMCMLDGGQADKQSWALIDYKELEDKQPEALSTLHRLFPSDSAMLAPGPTVEASWRLDAKTNKVDFGLNLTWALHARTTPIGWLRTLQREPELLHVEKDAIVQNHARYHASVSRETGFLTALEMIGADGVKAELALVELDLEPEFDAAVFVPPARPEKARDVSAELGKSVGALFHPVTVRRECYGRVDRQLASGAIEWDESARKAWSAVMHDLHEPLLQKAATAFLEQHRRYLASLAEWITKERARGQTDAAIREELAKKRAALETEIERAMADDFAKLSATDAKEQSSSHWEDLRAEERAVHDGLFREQLLGPALEELDAAVAKALDG